MTSKLKEAREAAGYSIDDVAGKLNIRKQYLIALEEGNYDVIPGKIYVKGYTKIYYEFLGIDLKEQQENNSSTTQILNNNDEPIISKKYTKYVIICSIILLFLVVVSYNFLKSRAREPLITTQSDYVNDGNKQENSDGSYKTD